MRPSTSKPIELAPLSIVLSEWDEIEKRIKDLLKKEIYVPLLREMGLDRKVLKNSRDDLIEALRSGRLTFYRGKFSGPLNATLSKELRALGATWDRRQKCYSISLQQLPYDLQSLIRASSSYFEQKIALIDRKLSSVVPEELATQLKITKLFDRALWKTEQALDKSLKAITVLPKLTESQRQRLSSEWQTNMDRSIKDFTAEEVKRLRGEIQKSLFAGNRYGSAVQAIQDSYGVTARKAKFLARQETHLLLSKFKEVRYAEAGVRQYKWRCVKGSAMHPVRPRHQELNDLSEKGQLFRFDQPPVTSEPDQPVRRNNPGEDFNCLLEDSVIKLADGIRAVFRREYTGPLAILITQSGRKFVATPNHPVLTAHGWKALSALQESDNLICVKQQVLDLVKDDVDDREATIGEIFASARESASMETLKGTSRQFHGDGFEGEVNIIRTTGGLSVGLQSSFLQKFKEFFLTLTDSFSSFRSTTQRYFQKMLFALMRISENISNGLMRLSNHSLSFLGILKPNEIGLSHGAPRNFTFFQPPRDDVARDLIFRAQRKLAHTVSILFHRIHIHGQTVMRWFSSSSIRLNPSLADSFRDVIGMSADHQTNLVQALSRFQELDRVKDLSFMDFSGHVYNLETASHWYIGEGNFIQMNCRCVSVPLVYFKEGNQK